MTTRYKDIAHLLAGSIQDGLLAPGERIPSLRALCQSHGISLMTALAAYRHLEQLGLIEALPRSGYRVRPSPVPTLVRPAILRSRLAARSSQRTDVIAQVLAAMADSALVPLGAGCPSPERFPLASLKRLTAQILNRQPDLWARYSTPPGCPELRRQIALRLQSRGMEIDADEILVTTGAMEALTLSMRLLVSPGDLVAIECPTFFGIADAARHAGAKVIELPSDPEGGLDPARLAAACERHAVRAAALMPSFSNPTGSLMPEARKRAWMETLQARGVALVEDDIYGDLAWDGRKPVPLCALPRKDHLPNLLVGSFSKSLLPGGRVGYVAAKSPWIERLIDLKNTSTLANATLPEYLAAESLASGLYERHLRRLMPALQTGVHTLRDLIARHFPPGTRVSDPKGSFLVWVELPQGADGLALFRAAARKGISLAPGCLFSLGPGLDRFIRLNAGYAGDMEPHVRTLGRLASRQLLEASS